MVSMTEWRVPPAFQPRPGDYGFDLDEVLASIVGLHSFVPAGRLHRGNAGNRARRQRRA